MFDNILIPIDTAHESSWKKALPLAVAEAKQHGAKVTALAVVPDTETYRPEHVMDQEKQRLQQILDKNAGGDVKVEAQVERGDSVHKTIRRVAKNLGCDLIVMNSHHPELKDYVLGSNASQVVHHADCSVLVVR